jgi:hypothetical protein
MDALPTSDTPNGGSTAGKGRRSSGAPAGTWSFSTIVMICALVLYPLSVGPLAWCWEEVVLSQDDNNQLRARRERGAPDAPFGGRFRVLPEIYQPLMWAYGATPMVRSVMDGYLHLWGRLLTMQPLPSFEFRLPKLSPWEDTKSTGLPVQISSGSSGNAVRDFLNGGSDSDMTADSPAGGSANSNTPGSSGGGSGVEFLPCLMKR